MSLVRRVLRPRNVEHMLLLRNTSRSLMAYRRLVTFPPANVRHRAETVAHPFSITLKLQSWITFHLAHTELDGSDPSPEMDRDNSVWSVVLELPSGTEENVGERATCVNVKQVSCLIGWPGNCEDRDVFKVNRLDLARVASALAHAKSRGDGGLPQGPSARTRYACAVCLAAGEDLPVRSSGGRMAPSCGEDVTSVRRGHGRGDVDRHEHTD